MLSQLNAPTLSVAPSRSYNVPKICLLAGVIGAGLTAAAVAWASVTSGTVQTQEGARSDLDAKLISTVPHEGRRTRKLLGWMGAAVPPGRQAPAPEPEYLLPGHQLCLYRVHPPHRRKVPA